MLKKKKDTKIYVKHETKNGVKETKTGNSYKRKTSCSYWTLLAIVTDKTIQ